ncbi:hypothetical protein N1027_18415 [Herbiconiux sp. CPCC 205763]|uniref:SAF domain-containing protein n=1 Tax=Herbiconiux aconitum TaxID=2970913 RepID=A0ABT2GYV1_9MICO|nr:hypothetical protein [Herbiconiux aconitum]MCS5720109.1 hypothetical protein [Herbiconiux aconitum]
MTTPSPATPPSGLRARASAASAKVPTKWLVSGLVGTFLIVSAAFGGLNDAAPTPLPVLAAGDAFTGAQLRIAVDRAVLIDAFPEQNIVPDEGKRLLVVVATVEDVWTKPVSTLASIGAADNLRPVGVTGIAADSAPRTVAVLSDGSQYPELQPGVPIQLAFIWDVDRDALADGDPVRVDVYDKSYQAEGFVTFGERFDNPVVAAYAELPIDDVGAGAEPEPDSDADAPDSPGAPDAPDAADAAETAAAG